MSFLLKGTNCIHIVKIFSAILKKKTQTLLFQALKALIIKKCYR